MKSTVFRKKTHSDQYLKFTSLHPRHQTLGVVRTLMNRGDTITSEEGDKKEEEEKKTIEGAVILGFDGDGKQ